MSNPLIKHVTDASFQSEVLQSKQPVLVDFWAQWCHPCKQIAPILEELASTYDGKMKFVKIDVDECHAIPARFGIRGFPTLAVFKNGQIATTHVGSLSKPQLAQFIDKQLA
jgi:thioredoxin 1